MKRPAVAIALLLLLTTAARPARAVDSDFDVTDCLGGLWSPVVNGVGQPWAYLPESHAWYASLILPSLPPQTGTAYARWELDSQVAAGSDWESLSTYTGARVTTDSLGGGALDSDNDGHVHLALLDGPPPDPHPQDVLYYESATSPNGFTVIYRRYDTRDNPPPATPPRVHYVLHGDPVGVPRTLAGACSLAGTTGTQHQDTKLGIMENGFEPLLSAKAEYLEDPAHRQEAQGYTPSLAGSWARVDQTTSLADQFAEAWDPVPDYVARMGTAFPNPGATYLGTFLDPANEASPLYVARFRVPQAPTQVRYVSVCNYQSDNVAWLVTCAQNQTLDPDGDGWAVLVIGDTIPDTPEDVLRLPMGGNAPLLVIRYLVSDRSAFPESPEYWDPAQATLADHMGSYFPHSTYCSATAFVEDPTCGLAAT